MLDYLNRFITHFLMHLRKKRHLHILTQRFLFNIIFSFFINLYVYAEDPIAVEVVEIKEDTVFEKITLIGTIRAQEETVLKAKLTGVLMMRVPTGSYVEKGDVIAECDIRDLQKKVVHSKHSLELARKDLERAHVLYDKNIVSQKNVDHAYKVFLEAQQSLTDHRIELEKSQIIAPFKGYVGAYRGQGGQSVSLGDPVVSLHNPNTLEVLVDLPFDVLQKAQEDTTVTIEGTQSHLQYIHKILDPDTNMGSAVIPYKGPLVIIGAPVKIEMILNKKKGLVVPTPALFYKNEEAYVYVIKDNKAVTHKVVVGIEMGQTSEITEGLIPHASVVLKDPARLYDGAPVSIVKRF